MITKKECLDMLMKLKKENLLTETQMNYIINKRDKKKKEMKIEAKKMAIKRKIRYCSWCGNKIKGSGTFFCSRECSKNKGKMSWDTNSQCYKKY